MHILWDILYFDSCIYGQDIASDVYHFVDQFLFHGNHRKASKLHIAASVWEIITMTS